MKQLPSHTDPIPDTVTSVPGYPNTLQVYMIPASSYWQTRAYIGKRLVRRSTKTAVRSKAIVFARDFYHELLLKRAQGQPLTDSSDFKDTAEDLLKEDQRRVDRGERAQSMVDDARYILNQDMLAFFKKDRCRDINFKRISAYVEHLEKRNLTSQTIRNHFIVLRKILKHAMKLERLDHMPVFPSVQMKDHPRAWLNDDQYQRLLDAIRKAIRDKAVVRYVPITDHLRDLTEFMVNSFLRPQDIKILKNKHIEVIKKPGGQSYLRIMCYAKTAPAPVVTTSAAVSIYENQLKGDPEAYVFFPNLTDRDYAMSIMSKQFKYVLEQANLYEVEDSPPRTLYSLRHTCIMNQLLYGSWSKHMIAKNCRTSEAMIERFYGSHLEAEMNIEGMHQGTEPVRDTLHAFFV